jgi:hypothetical protein
MWKNVQVFICALLAMSTNIAWSSDACSTRAITAAADVNVSDGSSFKIESYFHSKDAAAIRHIRNPQQMIVVEGPQSWTRLGDDADLGTNFHKLFALGHQFHAFMLYFEDVVSDVRRNNEVLFENEKHRAASGDYPYGGVVHLVEGDDKSRPVGLLFEFPENTVISVRFDNWRNVGDLTLPFDMRIDDGDRIFDYRYSEIDVTPKSPLWFFDTVSAPPIDFVQVYRLHRKLLAAHCLGDADMIANLSAPQVLSASRGELRQFSRDAMRERFTALFQALNYTEYHDIVMPVIDLSAGSDLGWIGVNVRANGAEVKTGTTFSDQWAWVMMVKKIDNVWVHAGNASSSAE